MGYRKDKKNNLNLVKTIDINGYETIIFTLPASRIEGRECSLTQEGQYKVIEGIKEMCPNCKVMVLPPNSKMTFVKSK